MALLDMSGGEKRSRSCSKAFGDSNIAATIGAEWRRSQGRLCTSASDPAA